MNKIADDMPFVVIVVCLDRGICIDVNYHVVSMSVAGLDVTFGLCVARSHNDAALQAKGDFFKSQME